MNHETEWHTAPEPCRQLWLRTCEARAANGEMVALAVWPQANGDAWEWEVLVIDTDHHIRGGVAQDRIAAIQAAELAADSMPSQGGEVTSELID